MLGNVGVFVDASVDPETLTHSKAALATALVRQGLVAEAMRGGGDGLPLLRGVTAQTLAGVAGEEQVIVFGERVWCLRQLARTLRERHGDRGARRRRRHRHARVRGAQAERFTAGEFPVLCLSRIGHEGHNLQNASVLCHLDLPWLPTASSSASAGRPTRRGPRARADLHPVHPPRRGSSTSSRCSPRAAPSTTRSSTASRASAPPRARRDPARPDHRPGRRQQGRRRLRRDRRPSAGRRERVRQLTKTTHDHYD